MTLPEGAIKQLEIQGRYVLVAPLAAGQRVLDVGGHSVAGLVQLAQAEPGEVAVTHDNPRAFSRELDRAGIEGIDVQQDGDTLPYEDGSYDIIICHDLAERLQTSPAFMDEIRRVLSAEGYLLTAVVNPNGQFLAEVGGTACASALSYEELNDQVAQHFSARTLFGQSPVVASLFFDFEDESEEPGLTLDRALMPDDDEQPGWYVLLYGPQPQHRDDLAITQLPFAMMVEAAQSQAAGAEPQEAGQEQADDGAVSPAAQQVIQQLEAERQAAQARAAAAENALHALQTRMTQAPEPTEPVAAGIDTGELESELAQARGYASTLSGQLQATEAQLEELRAALNQAQQHAQQTHEDARTASQENSDRSTQLQQELDRTRHDKSSYEAQIKDLLEEVGQLRSRDEKRQQELQHMQNANSAAHQQLLRVQEQLQARAQSEPDERVTRLQQELAGAQEELRTATVARQGLEAELGRLRAATASAQPVASRPRDAVGRVLDTAVEELEDLLKDVAPPVSSGR